MNISQNPSPNYPIFSDENFINPFMDNFDFTDLIFDVNEGGNNNGFIPEETSSPISIVSSETFTGESGGSGSGITTSSKKEPT